MTEQPDSDIKKVKPRRKPLWRRIVKCIAIVLIVLVVLIGGVFSVALWYLTPERLTPLVNKYASEYLDAEVRAGRVELTFWSTFPRLNLDVDRLEIISHSLRPLSDAEHAMLPSDADSLLRLERLSGGVHLLKAAAGTIELYDLELTDPWVNLVVVNDSVNNFNIVPPSEPSEEPSSMKISFNRFALLGSMPVRYRAPADSIDFTLTLDRTELSDDTAPLYALSLSGNTGADIGRYKIPAVPFGIDGDISFDINDPRRLELSDFTFSALGLRAMFDAGIDLSDDLMVDRLEIKIPELEVGRLIGLVPEKYVGRMKEIDTDLKIDLGLRMLEPYRPASSELPRMQIDLSASASRLKFDRLNLSSLDLVVDAVVDAADPDRSVIDIERFDVVGHAMDFRLNAKISTPLSDPAVEGTFSGGLSLGRLPSELFARLSAQLTGRLRGNAAFRFRMSQLDGKRFHKVKLDGDLSLSDFRALMTDGSADAYMRSAKLRFGANSNVRIGDHLVDSLLTASMTVDTASFNAPGIHFAGRDMAADLGSRNVASSSDTSMINPIGGSLRAGLITLTADSSRTRIRLRDALVGGALRRYNSNARSPRLDLKVEARRMSFRDAATRASVSGVNAEMHLNPRSRRPMSPAMRARVDSLAAVYPELSTDSLRSLAFMEMRRNRHRADTVSGRENIDFGIDNSLASWLRLWQLSGSLTARKARCFTPYFPARSSMTHLDMDFSTDSVVIRDTRLKTGHSDFTVNGSIRNISRALISRRHTPIELEFDLVSDTIDINDITATAIRGAAYAGELAEFETVDVDDDESLDEISVSTDTVAAVLIPSNVTAALRMRAAHIRYGDMWLNNFEGNLNIFDGSLSLDRLKAFTDMGSLAMTALYSAPTKKDISFAAGINISRLNLKKVLGMMPEIDSLMPMLGSIEGIVDAGLAMSTGLDSLMNIRFNTLDMALRLSGDSLVLLDSETFRTVAKWMMFKNKKRNMIDHMDVEVMVHDGWLDLYPVVFDMDRYRLGVVGNNDMNLNLDYHVAVLKSPLPFKFGINIKGTPEKMKIRLGKARLNEKSVASQRKLTDSLQVNLMSEIRRTLRRGVRKAGKMGLKMQRSHAVAAGTDDGLTAADSAAFIREGLIDAPEGYVDPSAAAADDSGRKKSSGKTKSGEKAVIPGSNEKKRR